MSREVDRISSGIACLDTENLPATLISTVGAHCKVWQSGGYRSGSQGEGADLVIKQHLLTCSPQEAALYHRDYLRLKGRLNEMIPLALFVRTRINGRHNLLVIARAFTPWFNIANPANEEEAIPLLCRLQKARKQLERFVLAARRWHQEEQKVIDLYGIDNLVLDRNREIRFLDSFEVFFHEDLLHFIDDPGEELKEKIMLSLQRLDYLDFLLRESASGA
jgi:hypothetical protein